MNTKFVMTTSSILLGCIGLLLLFLPQESFTLLNISLDQNLVLLSQCFASLYLGLAMMNWYAKDAIIGGIYNRPLVLANFIHFFISTISLFKLVQATTVDSIKILGYIILLAYFLFGCAFIYLLLHSPKEI